MEYMCERVEREEQATVYIRTRTRVGELPGVIGAGFGKLAACLGQKGLAPAGGPYVGYHNEDMDDLDVEIGFPVAGTPAAEGEILAGSIPAGSYAACMHRGPYSEIEGAYTALMAWIQEGGLQPTGVCYEIYLNDPDETAPEELLTQVLFPVSSS